MPVKLTYMVAQRLKIYVDTSVFGGVFDKEFADPSKMFLRQAQAGRFHLVVSSLVKDEIDDAPERVRKYFELFAHPGTILEVMPEAVKLSASYLESKIVSENWAEDALHVAIATVSGCSGIVSWNFKHIVNFQKVPLYNAVNTLKGYSTISIWSPPEVINYEEGI